MPKKKVVDIEWLDPDKIQSMEKIQFSEILRFAMLQIVKSQVASNTFAFKRLVSNLDHLLVAYRDNMYYEAKAKVKEEMKQLKVSHHPRERWRHQGDFEMAEAQLMFEVVLTLMSRKGFLAEKSFGI